MADATQRELHYRKRLIEIANQINAASSIQDILVDLKDEMLDLVAAERVTIFALDTKNQELFSLFKAGQEVKEIRVPKTFASIAGFTALSRKTVEHQGRLRRVRARAAPREPALRRELGQEVRLPTDPGPLDADPLRQVPARRSPARQQAGRHRLLRARPGGGGGAREDPGHRLLQPAPGRPSEQALEVRRPHRQGPRLREGPPEGDRDRAHQPAGRREDPDRGGARPEGGGPAGAGPVLRLRVLGAHRRPGAPEIKERVSADFLKKNLCAPLERHEGTVRVAVEDPYDLTRLDAIKAMNLAPRYEFVVGLKRRHPRPRPGELR